MHHYIINLCMAHAWPRRSFGRGSQQSVPVHEAMHVATLCKRVRMQMLDNLLQLS